MAGKEQQYAEYIRRKFPQLLVSDLKFNLSDGKYNDVVIVNQEEIFKFSKYDWTGAFLTNEAKVIQFLSGLVTMPLPKIEFQDRGVLRYRLIPGVPLFRNEVLLLKDRDQDFIAEQIGQFLMQMHSVSIQSVKQNKIDEIAVDLTREGFLSEFEAIQRKVFPYCDSYGKQVIRQLFEPIEKNVSFLDFQPALIHADLTPGHLLYDAEHRRLNGMIGFGTSGIGDPAYDVSSILDNIGESFVKRIARFYSGIEDFIDRARFYSSVNSLRWELEVADRITTRDFSQFQFPLKERDIMPIGSRW